MIDWTVNQGEQVRQMILDRMDYLRQREENWRPMWPTRADQLRELKDILSKLEAAYAVPRQ
jgi:hypothetical protein